MPASLASTLTLSYKMFVNIKGLCPGATPQTWGQLKTCLVNQANLAPNPPNQAVPVRPPISFYFQSRTTALNVLNIFQLLGYTDADNNAQVLVMQACYVADHSLYLSCIQVKIGDVGWEDGLVLWLKHG